MGNLWLNIRFGRHHLQAETCSREWWKLRWDYNGYHADSPWWDIEIYELRWPKSI